MHRILEAVDSGNDPRPILKEYRDAYYIGETGGHPEELMDVILQQRLLHFKEELEKEEVLGVEIEVNEVLDEETKETFSGKVDKVYKIPEGFIFIKDYKTTSKEFKHTYKSVMYNQQLLMYVPYIEKKLGIKVDGIEIEEIKLHVIDPVPYNANGKPTADKRRLTYVLHDTYLDALKELGLEKAPEYQGALEYLTLRGHPLFKRTRVHLLKDQVVDNNLEDMSNIYLSIKDNKDFRIRGPLCNYCEYKELCNLDMHGPDEDSRKLLTDQFEYIGEDIEEDLDEIDY